MKHLVAALVLSGTVAVSVSIASAAENAPAERMAAFVSCMEAKAVDGTAVTPYVRGMDYDVRAVGNRIDTRFAHKSDAAQLKRYNDCRVSIGELRVAAN
tara:strand:+ start:27599 stop:27895 length:297 start_codon:yes stop_codon:yes gene_type:complete